MWRKLLCRCDVNYNADVNCNADVTSTSMQMWCQLWSGCDINFDADEMSTVMQIWQLWHLLQCRCNVNYDACRELRRMALWPPTDVTFLSIGRIQFFVFLFSRYSIWMWSGFFDALTLYGDTRTAYGRLGHQKFPVNESFLALSITDGQELQRRRFSE